MSEVQIQGEGVFCHRKWPSLNKVDLRLLENEYTFSVNAIFYKYDELVLSLPFIWLRTDTLRKASN